MKRLLLLTVALFLCLSLCSCSLYDLLGIDTHDYAAEPMTETLATDGEVAKELCDMITMMVQNTPHLSAFDAPNEAAELYRNGILCAILERNYSKYNANTDLIAKTKELYPAYEITTVIPAVDFESTVYRYFGGSTSVDNRSTDLFIYLDKVDAYISVGIGVDNAAEVAIGELYATENTYVCTFTVEMHDTAAGPYRLLCLRRTDGTFYMKTLTEIQ